MPGEDWVDTWVSTPQPTGPDHLPPEPFTRDGLVFADSTLRQTVRASVGGRRLRLCLSHAFGASGLAVTAVAVALPLGGRAGARAIQPGTLRQATFRGRPSTVVPAGARVESDPLDFPLPAGSNLTVTMHLAAGQPLSDVTSHPGSRTTSYLAAGDRVTDPDLPGATPVDHWYFLSGLRVPARPTTAAAVMIGDSLTDGRGSTTNRNDRWPDRLSDRLRAAPETGDVAVLNHGVGGGRLLDDGRGPGALDRLVHAALDRAALRWVLVLKGVNDIGAAAATTAAQQRIAADLTAAYDQLVTRMRGHGVRVYGATVPPFGGHAGYDDPPGCRQRARQAVNHWIRTSGRFDSVVDADLAVRDPARPHRLLPGYDDGDHLHLNPAGYAALAGAVPLSLFHPPRLP